MTEREALKMTLESLIVSLPDLKGYWKIKAEDAIAAAKEILAQPIVKESLTVQPIYQQILQVEPKQKPMGWITYESAHRLLQGGNIRGAVPIHAKKSATAKFPVYIAPPQQERNFCPRCGKRLGINDWDVHTCTPPRGKE